MKVLLLIFVLAALRPVPVESQTEYAAFVVSEAVDRLALVRFGTDGARIDREITVGMIPVEPDGPHGVAVSPDGQYVYFTTGHGVPWGYLWKYDAETLREVSRVMLGDFPATVDVTPDGHFAYVVNFNLHGDMVPSSVSVVETGHMLEVIRIPTCVMPHGSRIDPTGTRHYSACMMDDLLVEIDTRTFAVSRHFMLAAGREHGMDGAPRTGHGSHGHGEIQCSPTWAQPSADGARIWVACNKSNEIVEIDADEWSVVRRLPSGDGVYNLDVTRDGRLLVATNKRGQSVSIFDTGSGMELARISTSRPVVHGVAVTPDDRYAFISVEGIGAEPGTVEVVDLNRREVVATVDVGQMAGGIATLSLPPSRKAP